MYKKVLVLAVLTALVATVPHYQSKLFVTPKYVHLRLNPGCTTAVDVTVYNGYSRNVTISPTVIGERWITVSPRNITLRPGQMGKLRISVSVPENASAGMYRFRIRLTLRNFVLITLQVYRGICTVYPKYVYRKARADDTIVVNVTVRNGAKRPEVLNPVVLYPEYCSQYVMPIRPVKVVYPKIVQPNESANVSLIIRTPNRSCELSGILYLGINDSNVPFDSQLVRINVRVVKTSVRYVRSFEIENASVLVIKIEPLGGVGRPVVEIYSPSGRVDVSPIVKLDAYVHVRNGRCVSRDVLTYEYVIENPENGVWRISVTGCPQFKLSVITLPKRAYLALI